LTYLSCIDCTRLTSIPNMPKINTIYCSGCTSLTKIESRILRSLHCQQCKSLTDIRNVGTCGIWYQGATWISANVDFSTNIRALKRCQAMVKRKLIARKLERTIPEITAIYYSPGYKGEWIAEKSFKKVSERIES
jgi:hypothetical protein